MQELKVGDKVMLDLVIGPTPYTVRYVKADEIGLLTMDGRVGFEFPENVRHPTPAELERHWPALEEVASRLIAIETDQNGNVRRFYTQSAAMTEALGLLKRAHKRLCEIDAPWEEARDIAAFLRDHGGEHE